MGRGRSSLRKRCQVYTINRAFFYDKSCEKAWINDE